MLCSLPISMQIVRKPLTVQALPLCFCLVKTQIAFVARFCAQVGPNCTILDEKDTVTVNLIRMMKLLCKLTVDNEVTVQMDAKGNVKIRCGLWVREQERRRTPRIQCCRESRDTPERTSHFGVVEECASLESNDQATSITQIGQILNLQSRRMLYTFHTCRSWEVNLGLGQAEKVRDKQCTTAGMKNVTQCVFLRGTHKDSS